MVPDSGATSHITSVQGNIQQPRAYNGNIYTTDGSPLLISQSGRSIVRSKNQSFVLQDILLMPSTTRNLLSVNKFSNDNRVALHFDSQRVQVKDADTNDVLLEGKAREGLYELPLRMGDDKSVNLCVNLPHYLWHY